MKKIVILGATSTMIQPLLRRMANDGMELLLVARSQERLDSVRSDLLARGAANVLTFETDLTSSPDIVYSFAEQCFRDFDTLLLSYGTISWSGIRLAGFFGYSFIGQCKRCFIRNRFWFNMD